MTLRRIVLDANILIRAVLGRRVIELISDHAQSVHFSAPSVAFADAAAYLPTLIGQRGIRPEEFAERFDAVRALVEEIPRGCHGAQTG